MGAQRAPHGLQPSGFGSSAPAFPLGRMELLGPVCQPSAPPALSSWAPGLCHPISAACAPQRKPARAPLFVSEINDLSETNELSTGQWFSRHIPASLSSDPMDFFGDLQRSPLKHVCSLHVSCQNALSFF